MGMGNTVIIVSRVWSGTGRGLEFSYLPKTAPIPRGFTGMAGTSYVVVLEYIIHSKYIVLSQNINVRGKKGSKTSDC